MGAWCISAEEARLNQTKAEKNALDRMRQQINVRLKEKSVELNTNCVRYDFENEFGADWAYAKKLFFDFIAPDLAKAGYYLTTSKSPYYISTETMVKIYWENPDEDISK
jgi:hypothetical protein